MDCNHLGMIDAATGVCRTCGATVKPCRSCHHCKKLGRVCEGCAIDCYSAWPDEDYL